MAILCSDMLADLNDRLNDVANTQIVEATKIRYLNHGLRAMWPRIYRTVQDSSQVLALDDYEYTIPAAGDNGYIVRVDLETGVATNIYVPLTDFEVMNTNLAKVIRLRSLYGVLGAKLRVTAAVPLTDFTAVGSTYDGPPIAQELPVLYAFATALGRRLDDRVDHRRLSTTVNVNGVDISEIMNASQYAYAQFELLLDRYSMPLLPGV